MDTNVVRPFFVAAALALGGVSALAHHAIADYYDTTKTTTLKGTVIGIVGTLDGPHRILVVVPTGAGPEMRWAIESESQRVMEGSGMRLCPCPEASALTSVDIGSEVTVAVYLPKPGVKLRETITIPIPPPMEDVIASGRFAHLAELTTANGKKFAFPPK